MFETSLNIYLYYIIRWKSIAIECQYLKPTFKSLTSIVGILKVIAMRIKDIIYF